ncbi:LicD family protein [Methanobrevibacter sp.]
MNIINRIKNKLLNQSDMYRFYENEYKNNTERIEKLEKSFKKYKRQNNKINNSYNAFFNNLFIYHEIEPKELVKLSRGLILEILDFIDNVCKKHDMQWWLFGGTLLGAIRHQGYIPWDDDCDINMLREDYEKFYKIFPLELKEHGIDDHIEINTSTITRNGVYLPFMKLNYWLGHENLAFIDIFPTDYVYDIIPNHKKVHKQENRTVRERLHNGEDRETVLNDAFEKLHVSKEKTDILMVGVEDGIATLACDYEIVFPLTTAKYENKDYPCPNDYNSYLKGLYGENYMKVPKTAGIHGYYDYLSTHENVHDKLREAIEIMHEINENF